jgi:uncharacterized repeat protein (TIGR03803 family)
MTTGGGNSDNGTIFSIGTDGSSFTLLHEFAGGADDGSTPWGSLVIDTGTLYGMTQIGGDSNKGTIFSIGADGTNFTLLREFAGGVDDGAYPMGSLIIDSGTLYGTTQRGGDLDEGTLFSMGTDGNGFTLLHEFAGGADDGRRPYSSPLLDSGTLYGTTTEGGDSNRGTIFSIGADGTDFTLLREFAGGADDGRYPLGSLLMDTGVLYGLTSQGGDSNYGTLFSMGTDD